ncbi:MAG TPA: MBL fold metallo-hydrolase [Pyrinomonadaceae bacterium]|nr:MBL fold metallo-hydrolase [Pyrinomonadaceae bacterium]
MGAGNGQVYLKPNVLVEPLFNQWYAWANLISPASAAMYIANQHLKIMQSFVSAPQVHVAALKNPAMLGGPFINYDAGRAPAVRELMDRTAGENARMLEFAEAVKGLDQMLADEGQGYSLEPLYARVPEVLRGYVELVYDLNNHPSIRFMEGLLFRSPFYNPKSQSVAISTVEGDSRSFVFSTPRLKNDVHLHLDLPFDHEGLRELFKMKQSPREYGWIKDALGVGDADDALFKSFFTGDAPPPAPRYDGDGVRVRYFGHACVLIETRETSVLCDPVISYQFEGAGDRYTMADLPETIDYVLITHGHQDHCLFEPLLQLRHRIRNIVVPKNSSGFLADPSLRLVLRQIGFGQVMEMEEMEAVEVDGGHITALPFLGEHADLNIRTKSAYLISLKGKTVFIGADSNNIEPKLYEHIHDSSGDLDVLFVGMECDGAPMSWMYGPLMTRPLMRKMDQSRRLDGSDHTKAVDIVERMRPREVYVYAMGQEPWLTFLTSIHYTPQSRPIVESDRLVAECLRRDIVSERLFGHKQLLLG